VHVNYSIWGWVWADNNDPAHVLHILKSGIIQVLVLAWYCMFCLLFRLLVVRSYLYLGLFDWLRSGRRSVGSACTTVSERWRMLLQCRKRRGTVRCWRVSPLRTDSRTRASSPSSLLNVRSFICAHGASRYCFRRRPSVCVSVRAKSRKLPVANWCNLVGICPMVNARGVWKFVTFDLDFEVDLESCFRIFSSQTIPLQWLDRSTYSNFVFGVRIHL